MTSDHDHIVIPGNGVNGTTLYDIDDATWIITNAGYTPSQEGACAIVDQKMYHTGGHINEESINFSLTQNEMRLNPNDEDIAVEMMNISTKKIKLEDIGTTLDNDEGELMENDDEYEISTSNKL